MNNVLWFLLACFFVFLEIGHPGLLYFLALAGGSSVAYVVSLLDYSATVQYLVFFMASMISLLLVYLLVKDVSVQNKGIHRSNTDLLIGQTVTIVEVQSETVGQGKLGGENWLVKLQSEGELRIGMKVVVVGVQGCHLQVRQIV